MGELLIWIVLLGLPLLILCGLIYARYLKRSGGKDTPFEEDGA